MISKNHENIDFSTMDDTEQKALDSNSLAQDSPELSEDVFEDEIIIDTATNRESAEESIVKKVIFHQSIELILVVILLLGIRYYYPNAYEDIKSAIEINSSEKADFLFDFQLIKNTFIAFIENLI